MLSLYVVYGRVMTDLSQCLAAFKKGKTGCNRFWKIILLEKFINQWTTILSTAVFVHTSIMPTFSWLVLKKCKMRNLKWHLWSVQMNQEKLQKQKQNNLVCSWVHLPSFAKEIRTWKPPFERRTKFLIWLWLGYF